MPRSIGVDGALVKRGISAIRMVRASSDRMGWEHLITRRAFARNNHAAGCTHGARGHQRSFASAFNGAGTVGRRSRGSHRSPRSSMCRIRGDTNVAALCEPGGGARFRATVRFIALRCLGALVPSLEFRGFKSMLLDANLPDRTPCERGLFAVLRHRAARARNDIKRA